MSDAKEREVLRFVYIACEMFKGYPSKPEIAEAILFYDRSLGKILNSLIRANLIARIPVTRPNAPARYMVTAAGKRAVESEGKRAA